MFWWVNHKKTHKEEIAGGYIWSPKKNSNGTKNHSYDNMPKTSVGDTVFSFAFAEIRAIGQVVEKCKSATKPDEFGAKGGYWDNEGWLVKVKWTILDKPFRAKDNISTIAPLLSSKYAPIQMNGNGNQGCYLASISEKLANLLLELSGKNVVIQEELGFDGKRNELDNEIEQRLVHDNSISQTEKEQLIKARRGQGKFRKNLEAIESICRVTGLSDKRFLIASHCKPWRDSNNQEKLDGNNGLLLSPHIDKLFDKGWISFTDDADLIVSDQSVVSLLNCWGIPYPLNVGSFSEQQKPFIQYHRNNVLKSCVEL
ncbi:HNH endonuclease [Vibrio vulnificus]|nr:HNH endonuclease [Vibrio vulnificus]MCU8213345.1 HNH endonuclease [Vibrio vulnificus]